MAEDTHDPGWGLSSFRITVRKKAAFIARE